MKKHKGFTLAEVLITLGIIGVISALTLPTVRNNTTYKQLGTKMAKFVSVMEGATLAYVTGTDEDFKSDEILQDFMKRNLLIKETYTAPPTVDNKIIYHVDSYNTDGGWGPITTPLPDCSLRLKDGTAVNFNKTNTSTIDTDIYPADVYGTFAYTVRFCPMVSGINKQHGQQIFRFALTRKGYILPVKEDLCTTAILKSEWKVTSEMFESGGACYRAKDEWDTVAAAVAQAE